MVASAISVPLSFSSIASRSRTPSIPFFSRRNSTRSIVSALPPPYGDSLTLGLSSKTGGLPSKREKKDFLDTSTSYYAIEAKKGNPPVMPAVMTPGGPLDLSSVLFRNRIIFIGQPVNSQVAQRVISQLVTLATIDEDADILVYLNCPGGSTYSVLGIYDCMSWIKPKVGTVCFGVAASQGALLLAGGEKGMRYAMPNARIMIHQPQSGCGGHVEDVRRQVNEAVQSRHVSLSSPLSCML
uniref:ATP-dependent Clp protease proteolytic subunit n=1 Tax=Fagus sylvatica TaxID=28930 RepID=A0A2N9IDL7_FAGSY